MQQRRRFPGAVGAATAAAVLTAWPYSVLLLTHAVPPVRRVLVVGATHGNELTGAWVVQRLRQHPELLSRPSLECVETVLGNPQAYRLTRRFVNTDLNRQFATARLADISAEGYEQQRAKALDARFGPKAGPRGPSSVDFVIDLHTTTTSMGITYVVEHFSNVGLAAAAWCQERLRSRAEAGELPPIRILREQRPRDSSHHLISMAQEGLMIEVGPVPQGLLRHDVCTWMEAATSAVIDFLEALNRGSAQLPKHCEVFRDADLKIPWPVGADGRPAALFHRDFQGRDFMSLRKGDPIFVDLDGNVIEYDGAHGEVWPVFVNEGAYYLPESGLGFGLTYREEVEVPEVHVETR